MYLTVPGVVVVNNTFEETVTWAPPLEPNGIITSYQVIYFIYQRNVPMVSEMLDNDTTTYSIGGLGKQKYSYMYLCMELMLLL